MHVIIRVLYTHELAHSYVRRGITTYEKTGVCMSTAARVSTLVLFITTETSICMVSMHRLYQFTYFQLCVVIQVCEHNP